MKQSSTPLILLLTVLVLFGTCKKPDPCDNPNLRCLSCQSCNKGVCVDNCQNGICTSSGCQCDPGYYGTYCENFDPCYDTQCQACETCIDGNCIDNCPGCQKCVNGNCVNQCKACESCSGTTCRNDCLNGGTCQSNGSCNCPPGYYGSRCENVRSARYFKLERIVVKKFRDTKTSTTCWDNWTSNSADCYPELYLILKRESGSTAFGSNYQPNARSGNSYSFSGGDPSLPINMSVSENYILEFRDWDFGSSEYIDGAGGLRMNRWESGFREAISLTKSNSSGTVTCDFTLYGSWIF